MEKLYTNFGGYYDEESARKLDFNALINMANTISDGGDLSSLTMLNFTESRMSVKAALLKIIEAIRKLTLDDYNKFWVAWFWLDTIDGVEEQGDLIVSVYSLEENDNDYEDSRLLNNSTFANDLIARALELQAKFLLKANRKNDVFAKSRSLRGLKEAATKQAKPKLLVRDTLNMAADVLKGYGWQFKLEGFRGYNYYKILFIPLEEYESLIPDELKSSKADIYCEVSIPSISDTDITGKRIKNWKPELVFTMWLVDDTGELAKISTDQVKIATTASSKDIPDISNIECLFDNMDDMKKKQIKHQYSNCLGRVHRLFLSKLKDSCTTLIAQQKNATADERKKRAQAIFDRSRKLRGLV